MTQGYIYAMINPSIPDTVKVGKTTRDPQGRADELSAATGVATKFIVVYSEFFLDCNVAEEYVHTVLENGGHRVSSNREFFSAQITDVIKVIATTPGKAHPDREGGDISEFNQDRMDPWVDLVAQANSNYYGDASTLQDYGAALRLYKNVAKLGHAKSNLNIGTIYKYGQGVAADDLQALNYWKEGAFRGDWRCYGKMGLLYLEYTSLYNFENAEKCFSRYLEGLWNDPNVLLEIGPYADIGTTVILLASHFEHRDNYEELLSPIRSLGEAFAENVRANAALGRLSLELSNVQSQVEEDEYCKASQVMDMFDKFLEKF